MDTGGAPTTFGGNPIACEAALATIRVIEEENLLSNCRQMGAYAREKLEQLRKRHRRIGDVRTVGLMIGIEIVDPKTGDPDGETLMRILRRCADYGVLFYLCGNQGEVIRMIPPLTVTRDQIDEGLDVSRTGTAGIGFSPAIRLHEGGLRMNLWDTGVLLLLFLILIGIGMIGTRKVNTPEEYVLAGRNLGLVIYCSCLVAVIIGGAATVGAARLGYEHGISGMWFVVMLGFGIMLLGLFFSGAFNRLKVTTISELLGLKYGDQTRLISAGVAVIYTIMI